MCGHSRTQVLVVIVVGNTSAALCCDLVGHLVGECKIDDAEEKIDSEMKSIENSIKRWNWNEEEKCWELKKNDQFDGEKANDGDDQHVGNDEELPVNGQVSDDEDSDYGVDKFNGLEHESNIEDTEIKGNLRLDNQQQTLQQHTLQQSQHQQSQHPNPDQFNPNSTQSTFINQIKSNPLPNQPVSTSLHQFSANLEQSSHSLNQFNTKPKFISKSTNLSIISSSSPTQSNTVFRIDDADEKVDEEMESIESSMKRWTWNEVEKCWELVMNGQIDGDEGNDKVGEVCDDDEKEVEDMDEDEQDVGNLEEFPVNGQVSDGHNSENGVGQLNGLEHVPNIDCAEAKGDQLVQNMPSDQVAVPDRDTQTTENYSNLSSVVHAQIDRGVWKNDKVGEKNDDGNDDAEIRDINEDVVLIKVVERPAKRMRSEVMVGEFEDLMDNEDHVEGNERYQGQQGIDLELAQNILNGQVAGLDKSPPTSKHVYEHCGKRFKSRSDLVKHIRTHTGERPYKCPNCAQTFIQIGHLRQHLKSRQHDRLVCPHCDRKFPSSFRLENHIRIHTGRKLFVCTWENCRNAFTQIQQLKDHMCSHTGEKPHKCPWKDCTKVFIQIANLSTHFKGHISKMPFKCPWEGCQEKFVGIKDFRVHTEYHKGNRPVKGMRSEEVEGKSNDGRIMKNHVKGSELPFQNAQPLEENLSLVNGQLDDRDIVEMVNENKHRDSKYGQCSSTGNNIQ